MKERHIGMIALFMVIFISVMLGIDIGRGWIDIWSTSKVLFLIIYSGFLGGIIWRKS